MSDISKLPVEDLNLYSINSWSQNAQFWDSAMGKDGNEYFRILELPALERLVQPQKGETALDLGTGNGLVARWLASHGCSVTASDASPSILNYTRNYDMTRITLQRLDVTKFVDFARLIWSNTSYNIITMNMVIMDVPTIEPLAQAIPRLLGKNGRSVPSVWP
jgi:2-polyprenyl-3-methyl-5-hydroxy-6-metoxy-1,4-benzoquinol methylase